MKYFSNSDVAKLLKEISAAYAVRGDDRFKIIAYDRAADSIEHVTSDVKDLWEDGKLDTIPGLGKSIKSHLEELFKTGKVKHFENVKKGLPPGMFKLLEVGGMGPKNAYKIAEKLKIKDVADLEEAAKQGKVRSLAGFGIKSEDEILAAISELKGRGDRHLLPFAIACADQILNHLKSLKVCQRAEPLGSLRRMVATVGDVDIAVASTNPPMVIDHFQKFRGIGRVLEAGPRKAAILLKNGMQIDLIVTKPEAFGALLQHFTGSKNHNIHLREIAIKKGMSVSDYGIKYKSQLHEFKNEQDFYKFLGMDYIDPELREDTGEIEAAQKHKLPKLIKLEDIKGDVHLHSNYPIEPSHDRGVHSFQEIIDAGYNMKYEYVGLSDHSPGFSTHTKNQIVDLIKKRTKKIEQLKYSNKAIRILNLLEIDILTNGELSVPVEGLKLLNGAIAGIHSSHSQSKESITKRLLVAINSPYIQVISHPTNRLLQQREASEVDWPKIFEACAKTKTILEINAWPNRMDLPDTLIKEAHNYGVKLIINSDSHDVEQMKNMKFGISVARRGWSTSGDIVNTLPWLEFKKYFRV